MQGFLQVKRAAFSMVELIFVIVVLAIVATIGTEIIIKVYESFITQRAVHRSSIKTELAATQLANRLAYSIPGTVIGRVDAGTYEAIDNIPAGTNDRNILEWMAYDADSFGAITANPTSSLERRPVWSGYADVDAIITQGDQNLILTPGSRLSDLSTIIGNLSGSTKTIADAAILFPTETYTIDTIGYTGGTSNVNIHPVAGQTSDTNLTLNNRASRTFKEHYKLLWTAYAVVPVALSNAEKTARGFDTSDELWDLTLHYNYQPWDGDYLTDGSDQVLIRNVSVFNFTGSGATIRFKICQRETVGGSYTINTCKEKAVIR